MDIQTLMLQPVPTIASMDQELEEISARLRAVRRSKKLTLSEIERLSNGSLHAISLGSYERGDRAMTIKKAIQIAHFYEVPLSYLLTGMSGVQVNSEKTVIDLRRLKILAREKHSSLTLQIVISFISGIIKARQDFNGEVLSLRDKDCEYLTISIGCSYEELKSYLKEQDLLLPIK